MKDKDRMIFFVPMCPTYWRHFYDELAGVEVAMVITSMTPPKGSGDVGFVPVYSSMERAQEEYPDAPIYVIESAARVH